MLPHPAGLSIADTGGDDEPLARANGDKGICPQDFRLGERNVCLSLNFSPSKLDGLLEVDDDDGEPTIETVSKLPGETLGSAGMLCNKPDELTLPLRDVFGHGIGVDSEFLLSTRDDNFE